MAPFSAGEMAPALSRTARLALTTSGLSMPLLDGRNIDVEWPGVFLIAALTERTNEPLQAVVARVCSATGSTPEYVDELVERLRAAQMLIRRDADSAAGPKFEEPSARRPAARAPDFASEARFIVPGPLLLVPREGAFEIPGHDGLVRIRLEPREVGVLRVLRRPALARDILLGQRFWLRHKALSVAAVRELLGRLLARGVAVRVEGVESPLAVGMSEAHARRNREYQARLERAVRNLLARHDRDVAETEARVGRPLVPVLPVTFNVGYPPLALGLILGHARIYQGGRLNELYDLRPDWTVDEQRALEYVAKRPAVFFFSNYVWCHAECLAVSACVKAASPASVTVHGGPDTPKYRADVEAYFQANPHVDVTVRGEGEVTAAVVLDRLSAVFGRDPPDLSVLENVEGVSFRSGDRIVHTPDRARIADLNSVPSPYLNGLFDAFAGLPGVTGGFETNRGCPYGCTFCDWGSATLSKIRKVDLERVLSEMEWMARHDFYGFGPYDANFGTFERDVTIAEHAVKLKQRYGSPRVFGMNFAKNTVKRVRPIVELLAQADILTMGILSLQTMDASTLAVVERSNIKTSVYEELGETMRRARLPLYVDLMLGLPGQTVSSFESDLQACIDREYQVRIAPTELLVNSPMNDPSYREKHRVQVSSSPVRTSADGGKMSVVVASATFTRDDHATMMALRQIFLICENFGVLRQVARYVRSELRVGELTFYRELSARVTEEPELWPNLALVLKVLPRFMVPPGSWRDVVDELFVYLTREIGVAGDAALRTVLAVQHALLPARDRRYPERLLLEHDYGAWLVAVLDAKAAGHYEDWPDRVPALRSMPPGQFVVDDPGGAATAALGIPFAAYGFGLTWEMDSPAARPFLMGATRARSVLQGGTPADVPT